MKYFSGNRLTRLPLYRLVAGGLAALMLAGAGISAAAFGAAATPAGADTSVTAEADAPDGAARPAVSGADRDAVQQPAPVRTDAAALPKDAGPDAAPVADVQAGAAPAAAEPSDAAAVPQADVSTPAFVQMSQIDLAHDDPEYPRQGRTVQRLADTVPSVKDSGPRAGWQEQDGAYYYYDPTTRRPVTGNQVIDGELYQFEPDGKLAGQEKGIDVSYFQNYIDWNAVAADGITFAIIRVGYRGYGTGALVEDAAFRRNIEGATAAGLKVGVYFYSQAINKTEALEEANMVISLCKGYGLPMGVWFDTEKVAGDTGRADDLSAKVRTDCAVAFCNRIEKVGGFFAGVYSYASWFYHQLDLSRLDQYLIWIAQYRDTLDFSHRFDIWQYTSGGYVNGVPTPVDMNISYMAPLKLETVTLTRPFYFGTPRP